MTDKPDETSENSATPDEPDEPESQDVPVDADDGDTSLVEPGVVVEGDEIDLSEVEDEADDDLEIEDEADDVPEIEDEADDVPDTGDRERADLSGYGDDADDADDRMVGAAPVAAVSVAPAAVAAGGLFGDGPSTTPQPRARHRGRWILLTLLLLVGVVYVLGYFVTGARMPANTTIGGIDVSGKSPDDARAAVEAGLSPRADREIVLIHGKKEFRIKPADVGLALDAVRSVEQAGGSRSWDPRDMISLFTGTHTYPTALDVDDAKLQSAIGTIGEAVDTEVVEAQITFTTGTPVARQPRAGRVVSRSDTEDAIRAAYLVDDRPIEIPTVTVEPSVDSAGLARAKRTLGRTAVSGPVTLVVGDKKVSLPVSAYAPALDIRVVGGRLVPHLDAKKLAKPLTDTTTGIGTKAVDATVRIEGGKPVVVPGKEGLGLQPAEMATKLLPALGQTGAARAVEVEAKVVEPLVTTADAKALKITEKISEFETQFPYAEYRNINQSRAAELINGTILRPGQTFSFNNVVGERTVANGFVTGTVINGGVFREELGGGVSQVATTSYNAGFFGGMDDVEHHPHAFYINRYPVGREATVYFGSLDMRFKNPTKYGVLIRSYVRKSTPSSPGIMHVELWSTKVWDIKAGLSARRNARSPGTQYDDTDRCVPQDPIAGFDVDVYRYFFRGSTRVKTETDTATYQAADHVICGKKPKDSD